MVDSSATPESLAAPPAALRMRSLGEPAGDARSAAFGQDQDRASATGHVHAITLIRHGRTSYNASGRLQGQVDIPLDEVGAWQARQTAEALKALYVDRFPGVTNGLVVCSDLGRAAATAHYFADPLGFEVHPDERVRERDFGEWEGMRVEELARTYPEAYRSWAEFRGGELEYGAEPKEHVGARGVAALNEWSVRAGRDTDLFVFSHGAWISQTLQTLLGWNAIEPDFADLLSMRNAHWARLVPMRGGNNDAGTIRWRLAEYNHGPALADTDRWEHPFG